jgi:hypothetical protein
VDIRYICKGTIWALGNVAILAILGRLSLGKSNFDDFGWTFIEKV